MFSQEVASRLERKLALISLSGNFLGLYISEMPIEAGSRRGSAGITSWKSQQVAKDFC